MRSALIVLVPVLAMSLSAQREAPADLAARCQAALDELHERGNFPGGSAALILPDGKELTFTVGHSSTEDERALVATDRLLSGSIGKTYVAAAALHLVERGLLELDEKAAPHFAEHDWWPRMPNAEDMTVRQLLRHQSGLPRYVYVREFWRDVLDDPDRMWQPPDMLSYVLDAEPRFPAGDGWAYSDTNFIVVGMIVEKITGRAIYDYVHEHFLVPHGLEDTVPSDRREIPGLAQGYTEVFASLGLSGPVLEDGVFVLNPQFEWCGGGYANTPLDLARWARVLYSGVAFDGDYREAMFDGVAAERFGPGGRYGIGVIMRETDAGALVGHDGVFPGYGSSMGYFPDSGIAAAVQVNSDGALGRVRLHDLLVAFAQIAEENDDR